MCWKIFDFQGSAEDARRRAFKHCNVMGYSSPHIMPLISDLEVDEIAHIERKASLVPTNGIAG